MQYSMNQERDVLREPFFIIYLNGKAIPSEQHDKIEEVQVEDIDSELDACRLTILDANDYYFVNNADLVKGATLVVDMGHKTNHRIMFSGKISLVESAFGEDGVVIINITGIDSAVSMSKGKKTRKWENTTYSNVVKTVMRENGFNCTVTDTVDIIPQISQTNEEDLVFINRLATQLGFKFYCVNEGNYYFGIVSTDEAPIATLNYFCGDCSIISYSITYVDKENDTSTDQDIDSTTGDTESRSEEPNIKTGSSSSTGGITVDKSTGKDIAVRR